MWWFSKPPYQERVILVVDDNPVRSENGAISRVVKVNALSGGRVQLQVCFEDGTTMELFLVDFSAGGFTGTLRPDMNAEQFAQQFAQQFAELLIPTLAVQPVQETQSPTEMIASITPTQPPTADDEAGPANVASRGGPDHEPTPPGSAAPAAAGDDPPKEGGRWKHNLRMGAVGGARVAFPHIGFRAAGIMARSNSAGMMSSAAIAGPAGIANVASRGGPDREQTPPGSAAPAAAGDDPPKEGGHWKHNFRMGAIVAPLAMVGARVAFPHIGFRAAGIMARSYSAGMMSSAAIAGPAGIANVASRGGPDREQTPPGSAAPAAAGDDPPKEGGHWKRNLLVGAIAAPFAVVGAMVALPFVGFGAGGIAAGSYAAGMMSSAAITNADGVAAGSMVAVLQSVGAAGLGAAGTAAVAGTGAAVGATASHVVGMAQDKQNQNESKDDKKKSS